MKKYKLLSWHQLGSVNTFKLINSFPFDYHVIDFEHGSHMNHEIYPNLKTKNNLIARVSNRNKKHYRYILKFLGNIKSYLNDRDGFSGHT